MGKEYEIKYSADSQLQQAILQQFPGVTEHLSMETTYYDTVTSEISARKYTLRRRMENGRSVCTLKTPGKGLERGEWEREADSVEFAIPELCKLGAPQNLKNFLEAGLVPICGARFTRIARTLSLEDCTLELACDNGVLLGGSREQSLCEIEVELKSGSQEAADRFCRELEQQFPLKRESRSKFCRAFALYQGE